MNWGWKITLLYLSFVALILFMVFMSMGQKIDLETEDYYGKELQYQEQMVREKNTLDARAQPLVAWIAQENAVRLSFPMSGGSVSGTVDFYRPSDNELDFQVSLMLDEQNEQLFSSEKLKQGLWEVRVNWESKGEGYFWKERIYIN